MEKWAYSCTSGSALRFPSRTIADFPLALGSSPCCWNSQWNPLQSSRRTRIPTGCESGFCHRIKFQNVLNTGILSCGSGHERILLQIPILTQTIWQSDILLLHQICPSPSTSCLAPAPQVVISLSPTTANFKCADCTPQFQVQALPLLHSTSHHPKKQILVTSWWFLLEKLDHFRK